MSVTGRPFALPDGSTALEYVLPAGTTEQDFYLGRGDRIVGRPDAIVEGSLKVTGTGCSIIGRPGWSFRGRGGQAGAWQVSADGFTAKVGRLDVHGTPNRQGIQILFCSGFDLDIEEIVALGPDATHHFDSPYHYHAIYPEGCRDGRIMVGRIADVPDGYGVHCYGGEVTGLVVDIGRIERCSGGIMCYGPQIHGNRFHVGSYADLGPEGLTPYDLRGKGAYDNAITVGGASPPPPPPPPSQPDVPEAIRLLRESLDTYFVGQLHYTVDRAKKTRAYRALVAIGGSWR